MNEARHPTRGFTLLETMIALIILAFVMGAVVEVQSTTITHSARVYNVTTATQLLQGVVLDVEEIYRLEGFSQSQPEQLGETCELPDGFDRFSCEYDVLGLDMEGPLADEMGSEMSTKVLDSPLMETLFGGGSDGTGTAFDPAAAVGSIAGNSESIGALQSLLNPEMQALCGVNLARMKQNIEMIAGFIPEIIKNAAASTRKLRIRITWHEPGVGETVLEAETFLTSTAKGESEGEALGL